MIRCNTYDWKYSFQVCLKFGYIMGHTLFVCKSITYSKFWLDGWVSWDYKEKRMSHACLLIGIQLSWFNVQVNKANNPLLLKFLRHNVNNVVAIKIIYIYNNYSHLFMDWVETVWIPVSTDLDTINSITLISQFLVLQ